MKSILFSILLLYCITIPDVNGTTITRTKRAADCSSTYEAWSDWSKCSLNCGFCGRQNRTRTCIPVSGCSEPICTGDSVETQSCGSGDKICFYPNPNCCDLKYKKTLDLPGKRFYCSLREKSRLSVNSTFNTTNTNSDSEITTPAMTTIASNADFVSTTVSTSDSKTIAQITATKDSASGLMSSYVIHVPSASANAKSARSFTTNTMNTSGSIAYTSTVPSATTSATSAE
ncbi:hypothetical protein GCK72_023419 [Caenorhabditis remanei]|uniref:Uncharacterized protein n=1 Tax=Caenorhabditis remanei TaxID=31234 RepID=A0A6A5FWX6_CAERE|nr:hypothetical protein GCK72_023419 [Caenorhabditis remanei]KAF1746961.1 hypothetical protein GCK72_023419 [Caenorhabditis remanei]